MIDLTTSPPIPAPKKRKCLEEMSCSPLQWAGGEAGSGTQIDLTTSPPIPAPKNRKTAADAAPSQEWAGGARHGQEPGVGTQAWAGGAPAVGSSSARHHPGELEVDWEGDCWTDWDEKNDDYKRIDCNACRRDIPEGFRWSCCAKLGNVEGCTSGEGQTIDEMYETSEGPSEYEYDSDEVGLAISPIPESQEVDPLTTETLRPHAPPCTRHHKLHVDVKARE